MYRISHRFFAAREGRFSSVETPNFRLNRGRNPKSDVLEDENSLGRPWAR
jgi:hypothetical protein